MIQKPKDINISLHKIYSEDGLELDSLLFERKKRSDKVVLHIHGKEGHFVQNHFISYMGYSYPLNGYSFLTFNNRGHDYLADMLKKASHGYEWVTKGSAYEIIEDVIFDINGVISYLIDILGYKEVILQGHSLGPHKISYYLANKPKYEVKKIILLTTADILYQFNSSVPKWKDYIGIADQMIKEGRGNDLMPVKLWSNSPVSAKTYYHYTNPGSNTWIFNFTNPEIEFKHFNKLKQRILTVVPENDIATGIPQKMAMKILKERTISKDFTSAIIKNAVHNFASKEEELVSTTINWLKTNY